METIHCAGCRGDNYLGDICRGRQVPDRATVPAGPDLDTLEIAVQDAAAHEFPAVRKAMIRRVFAETRAARPVPAAEQNPELADDVRTVAWFALGASRQSKVRDAARRLVGWTGVPAAEPLDMPEPQGFYESGEHFVQTVPAADADEDRERLAAFATALTEAPEDALDMVRYEGDLIAADIRALLAGVSPSTGDDYMKCRQVCADEGHPHD